MKKQFLHEHHNRQDKIKKPDYQPVMREIGPSEPVPSASARLVGRASARENLLGTVRKARFVYRNISFKFGWSLEIFARKNNLPLNDEGTKETLEMVKKAAERDVEAFAERIMTAPVHKRGAVYYFDYETPQTECKML